MTWGIAAARGIPSFTCQIKSFSEQKHDLLRTAFIVIHLKINEKNVEQGFISKVHHVSKKCKDTKDT